VLPGDQRIGLEVANRGLRDAGIGLPQHPPDVRVPETFGGIVRVERGVDLAVVPSVIGRPGERGVLERGGAEGEQEETKDRMGLVRPV
jgi:hypothetical protein